MNAVISARSGVALLIDGDRLTAFEADAPVSLAHPEPARPAGEVA